ncbi:MAG: serine--tRNA ligase, partial [Candidatus Peregrinibacteria bacterium]|nr:serine--tRNA ligase [Candidatus Peregrinibacteria bacterium]
MLDLKAIRENPDEFKRTLVRKFVEPKLIDDLLAADETRRDLIGKTDSLKAKQNEVSKQMPNLSGDEKEKVLAEMKTISEERK